MIMPHLYTVVDVSLRGNTSSLRRPRLIDLEQEDWDYFIEALQNPKESQVCYHKTIICDSALSASDATRAWKLKGCNRFVIEHEQLDGNKALLFSIEQYGLVKKEFNPPLTIVLPAGNECYFSGFEENTKRPGQEINVSQCFFNQQQRDQSHLAEGELRQATRFETR